MTAISDLKTLSWVCKCKILALFIFCCFFLFSCLTYLSNVVPFPLVSLDLQPDL